MTRAVLSFNVETRRFATQLNKISKNINNVNKLVKTMSKSFRELNKALPALTKLATTQQRLGAQTRATTRDIQAQTQALRRQAQASTGVRSGGPAQGPPTQAQANIGAPIVPRDIFKDFSAGLKKVTSRLGNMRGAMGGLGGVVASLTAAFSARQLVQYANAAQSVANRLKVVLPAGKDVGPLFKEISELAIEARTPLAETAMMFQRLRLASKNLNVSNKQAMKTTELFSKLITVQGASAHEARSALTQFTQAIQSGKLAGDEFRSISENLPAILEIVAKETGKPIEQLKALAEQGRLTPDLLIRSLLRAEDIIQERFDKTNVTISQGLERLKTRTVTMVGEFLRSEKGAKMLEVAFDFLNKGLDVLVATIKAAATIIRILIEPLVILVRIIKKVTGFLADQRTETEKLADAEAKLKQMQDSIAEGNFPLGVKIHSEALKEQALVVANLRKEIEEQTKAQEGQSEEDEKNINKVKGMNKVFKKFVKEVTVDFNDFKENFQETIFKSIAIDFPQGVGDGFADMIVDGKNMKDSMKSLFKDMAKEVIAQIVKMIAQMIIMRTIMASLGMTSPSLLASGGGITGFFSGIGKTIGKIGKVFGFADGGNPPVGVPSLVGERGPELFIPRAAGTVVPNEMLGGGTIMIERLEIMPGASIDATLTEKPMSYWVDLTQSKILPALNTLGQAGNTTTLGFRGQR